MVKTDLAGRTTVRVLVHRDMSYLFICVVPEVQRTLWNSKVLSILCAMNMLFIHVPTVLLLHGIHFRVAEYLLTVNDSKTEAARSLK